MPKAERTASILQHIEFYCNEIRSTIQRYGDDIDVFLNDRDYQRSVCLSLIQIGELAKGLTTEFRQQENSIPWKQICGLRDIVVHTYGDLDFDEIFETVHQNVDDLRKFCTDWIDYNSSLVPNPVERVSFEQGTQSKSNQRRLPLDDRLKQVHETRQDQTPKEKTQTKKPTRKPETLE